MGGGKNSNRRRSRLLPPEAAPEQAMESVLRQITRGRRLPSSFVTIARGLLLLDSLQDEESMAAVLQRQRRLEQEAEDLKETGAGENAAAGFRAQELRQKKEAELVYKLAQERKELRSWAEKCGCSKAKAAAMLKTFKDKCKMSSPALRRVVLSHLRSVENPHKVCRNLGAVADALIGQLEVINDAEDDNAEEKTNSEVESAYARQSEDGRGSDLSGRPSPGKSSPAAVAPYNGANVLGSNARHTTVNPLSSENQRTPSIDEVAGGHSSPSSSARPASPVPGGRRRFTRASFPAKQSALRVGVVDRTSGVVSGGGGDGPPSVPENEFATPGRQSSWLARMKQRIRSSSADPCVRRRPKAVKFSPSPVGVGWWRGLGRRESDIKKRLVKAGNLYDSVTRAMDRLDGEEMGRSFEETRAAAIGDLQDVIQTLQRSPFVGGNSRYLQTAALDIVRELIMWITSVENRTRCEIRDHCATVIAILENITMGPSSFFWPSGAETSEDYTWGSAVEIVVFRPSKVMDRETVANERSLEAMWCVGGRWAFWGSACRYASKPVTQSPMPAMSF